MVSIGLATSSSVLVFLISLAACGDEQRTQDSATTSNEAREALQKFIDADANTVDAGDAFRLARSWARRHRRPGERFRNQLACAETAATVDLDPKTEETFECRVRFEKGARVRRVRLYMRSFNESLGLEVVRARATAMRP
jgi:hypothetical protein